MTPPPPVKNGPHAAAEHNIVGAQVYLGTGPGNRFRDRLANNVVFSCCRSKSRHWDRKGCGRREGQTSDRRGSKIRAKPLSASWSVSLMKSPPPGSKGLRSPEGHTSGAPKVKDPAAVGQVIDDETKEEHCRETKVLYDFHKCELCNDQRVYRESLYWSHIHEDHDGFFLKCWYCSENFRSRKLKTDHSENHCKAKEAEDDFLDCERSSPLHEMNIEHVEVHFQAKEDQSIESEDSISHDDNHLDVTDEQSKPASSARKKCPDCGIKVGKRTHRCKLENSDTVQHEENRPSVYARKQCPDCGREFRKLATFASHTCEAKTKVDNSSEVTASPGNKENNKDQEAQAKPQCPHCKRFYVNRESLMVHIRTLHKKSRCTICGLVLANYGLVKSHKLAVHFEKAECPHCKQKISKKNIQNHLNSHKEASHLCPECGVMFKSGQNLQVHLKRFHTPGKAPSMKLYIRKEKSKKRKLGDGENANESAGLREEDK
ncbi:hypothetical protein RP20_CCG019685 [Aedes albopictus]|nr:hypothetical protein RP20_CCG019685 [Aedes albopictus]